jgi:demethylmenaquinone methyltransferase/2-methoxy-6-polyprenyl-1,4-benzoquinol methylase
MQRYYNDRAPEYEEVYDTRDEPALARDIRRVTVLLHKIFKGTRVLEIGCGTGFWTKKLAHVAAHVTAIDSSPRSLAMAKRKRMRRGSVQFKKADMYRFRTSKHFDGLFAGFVLSHVKYEDMEKFFETMNGYSEAGATAVFLDNTSDWDSHRRDRRGNEYSLRDLNDGSVFEIVKNFPTQSYLRKLLKGKTGKIRFVTMDNYWLLIYQKA